MVQQAGGVFLAPIAGAVAHFGLNMPFFVISCVCGLTILLLLVFLKETSTGPRRKKSAAGDASPTSSVSLGPKNHKRDPALWLILLAFMVIMLCVSGLILNTPVLLMQPSFGLAGASAEETGKNVATAQGVV